jgi:small-conductance mechanosensitive channel
VRKFTGSLAQLAAALAIAVMAIGATPAVAQNAEPATGQSIDDLVNAFPQGLTPEQIDAILEISAPEALRTALRQRLIDEMAARQAAADAAARPDQGFLAFYGAKLRSIAETWPRLGGILAGNFANPQGLYPAVNPLRLLVSVIFLLGAGVAATIAVGVLLRPRRRTTAAAYAPQGRGGVAALGAWLLLDLCQIAAFFAAVLVCFAIMDPPHPLAPELLSILFRAALVALVVERVFALLTAPDGPFGIALGHAREAARLIYATAVIVTILFVLIGAGARILVLLGTPFEAVSALVLPVSILPFAFLIVVRWWRRRQIREGLERALNLNARGRAVHLMAPILATLYLVALWLVMVDAIFRQQSEIGVRALASLLLALLGPLVALSLSSVIARYYRSDAPSAGATTDDEVGAQVMRIMRAVWIVVAFLIVYGTALIWGVDPQADLGLGSTAVRLIFNVAIVVLLGFVAWSLIVNAIDRAMRRAAGDDQSTRAQRMKTLLPLLRRFLQIVLVVTIAMVLLSSMGIEIGPLLAGAGVVGIAIGLGAQQTIADILAGVFFLLEDSFRVGDYVEVGNIRGTVEGISMRSLKLRHHRGAVHTLPFGQMKSLTNYTRDWALMRLEFRVAPDTDTALVKRIVKDIGKELASDPEIGKGFIEPLKSQGIRNVEDGAIVIGVKFIAKPNEQFVIRREAYRRILDAFRENGIALVGRAVVVKVEGGEHVPPNVAAAAASEILRPHEEEG